jgi:hypothetical protein
MHGYSWAVRKEERHNIEYKRLEKAYREQSKLYHHDLAKSKTVFGVIWGCNRSDYYTNSLGFRDKSTRDLPLIPDSGRLVLIGDSFTEGSGINYEHTFAGLIDTALSDKNIEVLNAGVASYSPIIYWRKIKYLIEDAGLKFDRLAVFLDISDAANEATNYSLDESGNVVWSDAQGYVPACTIDKTEGYYMTLWRRFKASFKNNSILSYTILSNLYNRFAPKEETAPQRDADIYNISGWTIDDKLYKEYGQQGIREMQFYMDKLYELLKKNRIKLTVVVYPWPIQVIHHDLDSIHVKYWSQWCKKRKVDFINCFPYFVDIDKETNAQPAVSEYFIKDDIHFNEKGHRLMADIFLAEYKK